MLSDKNVKPQKNVFTPDKDIFTKVLENQTSEYISNIYFEFEKNNSIGEIFEVRKTTDLTTKLKSKKICC